MRISYNDYYNKVFGCFLGKCISGTVGAPYEGMKQFLDLDFDQRLIDTMLPNDDLDLQVLWLEVLEKFGEGFTSDDLADAFYHKCPYSPGEYAYFKKNYEKSIHPPYSGRFSNYFYANGMGSPIRSEIWACVAPCDEALAARLAGMDGVLDHLSDSVIAEQYLAVLESMAFYEKDMKTLVTESKKYIPFSEKLVALIDDVISWCRAEEDYVKIRNNIIRDYGHPDCTNLYQNIGITLMALLLGKSDIIKTTMIAVNCGFDTDCTAATVGAVIGIIKGGDELCRIFGITDLTYVLGVTADRSDEKISTLSRDIANIGVYFSKTKFSDVEITGYQKSYQPLSILKRSVSIETIYDGAPVLKTTGENKVQIKINNLTETTLAYDAKITCSDIFSVEISNNTVFSDNKTDIFSISIKPGECAFLVVIIKLKPNCEILFEKNIFKLNLSNSKESLEYHFGLSGGTAYKVIGPFWENHYTVPKLPIGESYYKHLPIDSDAVRNYHISMKSDFTKDYIDMNRIWKSDFLEYDYKNVIIKEDTFEISDLFGFCGPCVTYLIRDIHCEKEIDCSMHIGKNDAIQAFLNGKEIAISKEICYFTSENLHVYGVRLNKGRNRLVLKLARTGQVANFSVIFVESGELMTFPNQITHLGSYL